MCLALMEACRSNLKVYLAVVTGKDNVFQAGACETITCGEHNVSQIYKVSCAMLLQ